MPWDDAIVPPSAVAKPWRNLLVRYPAIPLAAALMLGITLYPHLPLRPVTWSVAGVIALVLAYALRHRGLTFLLTVLLAFSLLGVALAQRADNLFPPNHITHFTTDAPRLCFARLYLPNEPRLRVSNFGGKSSLPARQATIASFRAIRTADGAWTDCVGDALLQIREPVPELSAGQTVEVVGFLERPGDAFNPGQFDWQRYYRDVRVLVSLQVRNADNVTIVARDDPPWLTSWRERVRAWLAAGFEPKQSLDLALVRALVLGDYDPELRDVKEQFRATGTSHHLAISGMHVAVVGGVVFLLLRLLGVMPRWCWLIGTIVVIVYGLLATPSAPVWRSVLLFVVAGICHFLNRPAAAIQMLAFTVLAMLVLYPLDLFNAGFQLSFGTVLGLMLLSDVVVKRFTANEPKLTLVEQERLSLRERTARWIDESLLTMIVAGFIAWLVSMPIVCLQFEQLKACFAILHRREHRACRPPGRS
ncbi:MAG: ComEC/Rec2 family competence protein [Tepidisphaeraceae bacterium]